MRVRKLVFGSGHSFDLQEMARKRQVISMLREAGYEAAKVEPPLPLQEYNPKQIMNLIAPHQHKYLHHHHHHNNHHLMNGSKDNSYMMEKFDALQGQLKTHLGYDWKRCCHLTDLVRNPEFIDKERTTNLRAFQEAILVASQSSLFVASNTPGLVYCLWGPEGAGTLELSPKGPHDAIHAWKVCGWALNGSYTKVSVPRPIDGAGATEKLIIDRTVNCTSTLMLASIQKKNPRRLLQEHCRVVPEAEDVSLLCSSQHDYEAHRLNSLLGDLCRFRPDIKEFNCPTHCTRANLTFLCVSDTSAKDDVLPCRSADRVKELVLSSNSGKIVAAAHWNPQGSLKGDRMEPEWHNGNVQVIPDHPKPFRRGAFKPVSREKAKRTGCYQTLATARLNKAMWCPQGAGALTAG